MLENGFQSHFQIVRGWLWPRLTEGDEAIIDAATIDHAPADEDGGLRSDAHARQLNERVLRVAQDLQPVVIGFDVLANHLDRFVAVGVDQPESNAAASKL